MHTQGEWKVTSKTVVRSGHNLIADTLPAAIIGIRDKFGSDITNEACEANAKLIAAAPDLLEALMPFAKIADLRPKPDGTDAEWYEFEKRLKNCLPDLANATAAIHKATA